MFQNDLIATDLRNYLTEENPDNHAFFYDKTTGMESAPPYINKDDALVGVCVYHSNMQPGGQGLFP